MLMCIVQSSILGDLQTFVGVVITLIVLCIKDYITSNEDYSTNSSIGDHSTNYIRTIIGYIRLDGLQYVSEQLTKEIQSRISSISKYFNQSWYDAIALAKATLRTSLVTRLAAIKTDMESLSYEAVNLMVTQQSKYEDELNKFEQRNYDSLMALFILCVSMAVMLLDCIGLSNYFIYPFVMSITFFTIIYSINIWHAFYFGMKDKSIISVIPANGFELKEHLTWIVYDGIIVSLFIFFFYVWPLSNVGVLITISLFIILEFLLHKYVFTFSCLTENYFSRTEVLIHVFHFLTVSFVAGIVSFILKISMESNNASLAVCNEDVFNMNLSVLKEFDCIAYLFAMVITLDAFFLPIILSFVYSKRKAIPVKRLYEQKANEMLNRVDDMDKQYKQILNQLYENK